MKQCPLGAFWANLKGKRQTLDFSFVKLYENPDIVLCLWGTKNDRSSWFYTQSWNILLSLFGGSGLIPHNRNRLKTNGNIKLMFSKGELRRRMYADSRKTLFQFFWGIKKMVMPWQQKNREGCTTRAMRLNIRLSSQFSQLHYTLLWILLRLCSTMSSICKHYWWM